MSFYHQIANGFKSRFRVGYGCVATNIVAKREAEIKFICAVNLNFFKIRYKLLYDSENIADENILSTSYKCQ